MDDPKADWPNMFFEIKEFTFLKEKRKTNNEVQKNKRKKAVIIANFLTVIFLVFLFVFPQTSAVFQTITFQSIDLPQ